MRLSVRFPIVATICWMAAVLDARFAAAQENAETSTIRLTTTVEPTREDAAPSPPPSIATVEEQNRAPEAQPIRQLPTNLAPAPIQAPIESPLANRPRMPAGLYANASARATLNQLPGPTPVQSAPRLQQTRRGGKPFQSVATEPAISPYLSLYGGSNNANQVQNYFAFVRPQLDQLDANRQQQREIQQLRTQMQKMSSTNNSAASQQSASMGAAAHYMDTAQFYHGLQR